MGWLLYLITMFVNMMLSINRKNNKIVLVISLAVLFSFYAFNTYNVDLENYKYHFQEYISGEPFRFTTEIMFQVLLYSITWITSNFFVYMIITGIIVVVLLNKLFKELSNEINLHNFIWLLFAYPLMPFFTQIRSLLGGLIFCIYLLKYNKNQKAEEYLIGVAVASLFHNSYILFAPFVFYRKLVIEHDDGKSSLRKLYMIYTLMTLISVVFCFVSPTALIKVFSKYVLQYGGIRFAYMLADVNLSIKWYAKLFYVLILVIETIITYIAHNNYINCSIEPQKVHFITVIYEINLYSAIFMPLIFLTTQAERFFRIIFVINAITWSMYVKDSGLIRKRNFIFYEMVLAIGLFYFFVYKNTETFAGAFLPFFTDNLILGGLS